METLSQDSLLECQICFNYFSPRRRPKLLDCRHTCCSVCLTQMRSSHKEIRCPWCRGVTKLPPGLSVAHLPDDPVAAGAVAIPRAYERTPVFIRLPGSGCYVLPLPADEEHAASLLLERRAGGPAAGGAAKGSTWSGVCTVVLVACVLLFLLGIVLHNMSCISKRFTVISCG
uniref:RING-type E3 ubiquitin transferase n=1 Tax=Hippocampus comes TaxID=109280 RepID=A0A3Q2YRK6_HIPCM